MVLTISKRKAVPQFSHLRMQTFSWKTWKTTRLPYLRNFSTFYCRFLKHFSRGMEQKLNYSNLQFEFIHSRTSITFRGTKCIKMKMGQCTLLSIENQVIAVISCTINRRTQKHLKPAYHTVKVCIWNEHALKNQK